MYTIVLNKMSSEKKNYLKQVFCSEVSVFTAPAVQSEAQKLKLCVKKNVKIKKNRYLSTVDDGWGHGYYLVEALCLTKSSFSLLGMLIFWALFLQNASSKKLPNFKSSPNKKYLCWDNETWSEPLPDTYKET